eukprot:CAMPEP_0174749138 /NCGR_PEP_ID=MMETSP1094-20130205/95062_1 /TAXON_ID=156173 /ORGANISM="Chrysochromulina brevifilum, Strain UTEX LB 985" /LENGTH=37 /DNA_ID= /DNA_START= /DNA_END= /DNA_ORIENTATION=
MNSPLTRSMLRTVDAAHTEPSSSVSIHTCTASPMDGI